MRSKQFKLSLLLAGFVILTLLVGAWVAFAPLGHQSQMVAHHMAPNDNNVTTGNLNQEMVHHGFDLGVMPVVPEIGNGNLNRAEVPWVPVTPEPMP